MDIASLCEDLALAFCFEAGQIKVKVKVQTIGLSAVRSRQCDLSSLTCLPFTPYTFTGWKMSCVVLKKNNTIIMTILGQMGRWSSGNTLNYESRGREFDPTGPSPSDETLKTKVPCISALHWECKRTREFCRKRVETNEPGFLCIRFPISVRCHTMTIMC